MLLFTDNLHSNVSEPLDGNLQTNQRAELTAIIRALEIAPKDRDLEIITDSEYSIKCVTVWYKNWVAKNWVRGDGGEVKNKDLVILIRKLIDQRDARGKETTFTWIKGHDNDPGNEAADRLAVAGAMGSR
jgi:ribonuclease HI